ncbi:MAG: nitronate monooxygenase [Bacteroidota bacterium]|nr:nitronate monooxygenase [Bacteroidota bacterium]
MKTRITELFKIQFPIIQAGMVWVSGYKLAAAVSEAGGLGLIGAGSMKPDLLSEQIRKAKNKTDKPFGVNIPLLRGDALDLINVTIDEGVKIVFTSAGHPGKFIDKLKKAGCVVVHVIPSVKYALKAESVGCDAVVAEGFEAGGHNGLDEITTFVLIPQVVDAVKIPVIAAGGIADGRGMAAAFALGAVGVQIGTRFAASVESSAHDNYKRAIVDSADNSTVLILKKVTPVRLIKNKFSQQISEAENRGATTEELANLLGKGRERMAILEGNLDEGEIEAGQCAGMIKEILPAGEIVRKIVDEYYNVVRKLH